MHSAREATTIAAMCRTRTARVLAVASLLALVLALPSTLDAKGASHARSAKATKSGAAKTTRATVTRDAKGKIQRSGAARHAFARQTGYPHGRPGYVIDHVVPLACGGADAPSNMQWQTVEAGKAKDKVERKGCR